MNIKFFLNAKGIAANNSSYRVGNTIIHMLAGNPVLDVSDRWAELPADLKDHVVRVKVNSLIHIDGLCRRSGRYHLGNAESVVHFSRNYTSKPDGTMIEVNAPTKEEALELWDRILEGTIAPDDDYEAAQVSTPTVDPDRLAKLETQASSMAMTLLESAMNKLNERVTPTS